MNILYLTCSMLFAAFEPPLPAEPVATEDLVAQELDSPLPTDRFGLLAKDDTKDFELAHFFPKKPCPQTNLKHQASFSLGSANINLGSGSVQDALEAPAWMHLFRYNYRHTPLPSSLSHSYHNLLGVIALSDNAGSHVAIDGEYNHRNDQIPNLPDLNVGNTKLDIHIEDSSARDYKLSGLINATYGEIKDPINLRWSNPSELKGSARWIRSFPLDFELDSGATVFYRELRTADVLEQSESIGELRASLIKPMHDWAVSLGGIGRVSTIPAMRTRFIPQIETTWRVARRTAIAFWVGGYFNNMDLGDELVKRSYSRIGKTLALNEIRQVTWEGWHSLGEWVWVSTGGGYSEERLTYQWVATDGFVSPELSGRHRSWVANSQINLTLSKDSQINLAANAKQYFPGEEVNFDPDLTAWMQFSQKLTSNLEALVGEKYFSSMFTGDATFPQLPERWDTYSSASWNFSPGMKVTLQGENLANHRWMEIPHRPGEEIIIRTSVYAAF